MSPGRHKREEELRLNERDQLLLECLFRIKISQGKSSPEFVCISRLLNKDNVGKNDVK